MRHTPESLREFEKGINDGTRSIEDLRSGGPDNYSKMDKLRLKAIIYNRYRDISKLKAPDLPKSFYRWILRGASPELALKKVFSDFEIDYQRANHRQKVESGLTTAIKVLIPSTVQLELSTAIINEFLSRLPR